MKSHKLIYGVGYNDVPNANSHYKVAYRYWFRMLERCYSESYIKRKKNIRVARVDEKWHHFSNFLAWFNTQNPVEGMELDKDILGYDQNCYSEDTCAFIPRQINTVLLDCSSTRGEYPLGVSKARNKFASYCRRLGKRIYLGTFDSYLDAHAAWQQEKKLSILHTLEVCSSLYTIDMRIVNALVKRCILLEHQIKHNMITHNLHHMENTV